MKQQFKAHIRKLDGNWEALQIPDFPKGVDWLNSTPLSFKRELHGKVVILDFWTYCCINCIHTLPDLATLEEKYKDAPVVFVGVHSAKFANEKVTDNIRQAVLRYDITHPVINDENMFLWNALGIQSWPTLVVVGPKGNLLLSLSGEGHKDDIDLFIETALEFYQDDLVQSSLPVELEKNKIPNTSPLRFPAKLAASEKLLFISDSSNHRIVITDHKGRFMDAIGNGTAGLKDGSFSQAKFNRLQGLLHWKGKLYVADTENHAIREIDLEKKYVRTLVGNGRQGKDYSGGKAGSTQALSSPWDLTVYNDILVVAMAGTHQIWTVDPQSGKAANYSGSGQELFLNDPDRLRAAWAQPSGITVCQDILYIADSESSSIRGLDPKTGAVFPVIGGDPQNPQNLFRFGDSEGQGFAALLQHPLGVICVGDELVVADTYNHRLKRVDLQRKQARFWLDKHFSEPSGFALANGTLFVADTNQHQIHSIDLKSDKLVNLDLSSVPAVLKPGGPLFEREFAKIIPGPKVLGETLSLTVRFPKDHKFTEGIQSQYRSGKNGTLEAVTDIPIQGDQIELLIYYCKNNGPCYVDTVILQLGKIDPASSFTYTVPETKDDP